MIKLQNPKIVKLLTDKGDLVKQGRKISSEMETIEFKIKRYQDKEKKITGKVECEELVKKGNLINSELEAKMKELDDIIAEINKEKLAAIPKEIEDAHKGLMKQKEEKEREMNKIALKIQKIKDKVIPMLRKEVAPLLKEYEDTEDPVVENGEVLIKVYNHLDEYKKKLNEKYQR